MKTSESVKALVSAFGKAQAEITNPPETAENPHFKSKYAPLPAILNHVKPTLAKHGLAITFNPKTEGELVGSELIISHTASDEWIKFDAVLLPPTKKDPQGYGSAMTYAQRYALCQALGIAGDTDDDGNAASAKGNQNTQKQEAAQQQKQQAQITQQQKLPPQRRMTNKQRIAAAANDDYDTIKRVLAAMNIKDANTLSEDELKIVIETIRNDMQFSLSGDAFGNNLPWEETGT